MKPLSEVTFAVIDHSLFLPLAVELAKSGAKRVLYQNASAIDGFPTLNKCIVGDGYDNLEIIQLPDDHWDFKSEIDCYVFPDIYHGGEQLELQSQGKAVWGSRHGDRMEVFRGKFLEALESVGLEVPPHEVVRGLEALRAHLYAREDCYIKISRYRGTMETKHWRDWTQDSGWLDFMTVKLGPAAELITFYVFDAIETDIEIGMDTYAIGMDIPISSVVGYEWKDKGYFGAVTPRDEVPSQLMDIYYAFREELKDGQYRNFVSSEVRIKGERFSFIDTTRRAPCPAIGSQIKLYRNLGEIIWSGANGEMVQPEFSGKFACECVIKARAPDKSCWTEVEFPKELEDSIMAGGSCKIDDVFCWPPDESHGEEVGWLVNVADTPHDCIQGMLDKAAMLPDGVSAATDSLADLLKEVDSGKEQGIPFTKLSLPEPATVIENE